MTGYRGLITRLGDDTALKALAAHTALKAGRLSVAQAIAVLAAIIARANAKATTLADLGVAASLTAATRQPVPVLGLAPPTGDPIRLVKAATTLLDPKYLGRTTTADDVIDAEALDELDGLPDLSARVERLGRSEPLTRAQDARGEALAASPLVEGYTRQMSATPCQLCVWWWREGRVWPKDHVMPQHKGCTCTQEIVLAEHIQPLKGRS